MWLMTMTSLALAGQVESPNADAARAVDEEVGLVESAEAPQDAEAPLAIHWSEVKVREPVKGDSIAPATPPSGNGETVCDVRFFVDETGAPYDVKIEDCPEEYSDGVLETARRTLFEPLVIDGEAVKHQFVSRTTYRWWSKSPPTSGRAQAVVGLHWSEVSRNGRVAPSVPGDAPVRRVEPRVEARCTVGVFVDDRGRPSATVVSGCDSAHAASSEAFVKKWRFEPHHVDGEAVPFFLEIHIRRYRVSHKPF